MKAKSNIKKGNISQNYSSIVLRQFKKNTLAMISTGIVVILFIISFLAPMLANNKPIIYIDVNGRIYFPAIAEIFPLKYFEIYPQFNTADFKSLQKKLIDENKKFIMIFPPVKYSPYEINLDSELIFPAPPSSRHIMGTDELGRDILSRMIHGTKISLTVGFVSIGIALIIGIFIGSIAGYYGGTIDMIISRIIEIVMCFPSFFLILSIIAFLPPSIYNIMIAIGITGWTDIARLVRGEFIRCKQEEFVMAEKAIGLSDMRIIFNHILPNSLSPVFVSATFGIAGAILSESGLSFLGFGVQPPTPSWGAILSTAKSYIEIAWWLATFPGLAIFITVTSYNLIGEGLRDAMDPRLKI